MKRNAPVIVLAGVVVAVAAWELVPASTDVPTKPSHPALAATTAPLTTNAGSMPVGTAGYVVRLDGNGKMTTEPQAVSDPEFNAEMEKTINTSQEGLKQEPSPVPNGGVMIRLEGRFMTAMVATKDANGKVVVPCLTNENDVKAFEKTSAADKAARKE